MSRPRFLADHDFNHRIISAIRKQAPSVEILLAREFGLDRAADPAILQHAADAGLLILSHDVNTMCGYAYARVQRGEAMPGLFIAKQRVAIRAVRDDVIAIWSTTDAEDWADRVVFLPLPATD